MNSADNIKTMAHISVLCFSLLSAVFLISGCQQPATDSAITQTNSELELEFDVSASALHCIGDEPIRLKKVCGEDSVEATRRAHELIQTLVSCHSTCPGYESEVITVGAACAINGSPPRFGREYSISLKPNCRVASR